MNDIKKILMERLASRIARKEESSLPTENYAMKKRIWSWKVGHR